MCRWITPAQNCSARGLTRQCPAAQPLSGEQLQSGVGPPIMCVAYLDGAED